MGKKRKAGGRNATDAGIDRSVSEPKVKLNIQNYEDVADSEDEFHLNRDKVLLDEGPERKRQRKVAEEDAFFEPSDEEVLSVPDSEEDEENEDLPSEEDASEPESDDVPDRGGAAEEEKLDRDGWGTSKRDYYNTDAIETEADALEEEQEALRLQKKQLQDMKAADYGLDDYDFSAKATDDLTAGTTGGVIQEILPPIEIKETMTNEEKRDILSQRYPEFEPLSKEYLTLRPTYQQLSIVAKGAEDARARRKPHSNDLVDPPVAVVKLNALSSYLGALTMYFALFTAGSVLESEKPVARAPAELRDHPVMETLVNTRALWERLKDLPLPDSEDDDDFAEIQTGLSANGTGVAELTIPQDGISPQKAIRIKKPRRSKAQKAAEKALLEAQAKRDARMVQTEAELAELSAPLPSRRNAATESQVGATAEDDDDDSDFGDAVALTAEEAEAKAKRKRGLRFYTSQITQKSMKRDRMNREGGGDTDIPHRERFRDRQARLNAEAEARGRKKQDYGAELGGDSDEEDRKARKQLREGDNGDDYYDLVAAKTKRKKESKEALAAAQREAAAMGNATVRQVEAIGPDGKRAITYEIEKNKGLTPKRKKDVRNPRVKKRKKFEEKKKKLGSVRQVYKGGEGRGGYGGELTGIKKNLVKSVKL